MLKLDDLLVGGMKIYQDDGLYKFTSDSVLLSRFARAKKEDVVADFCAGSGIVGLHFYALNRPLVKSVTLLELCALAEKSVAYNALGGVFFVRNEKIQAIPAAYNGKFSLILCNPPYYPAGDAAGKDFAAEACRYELTITPEEIAAAAARCPPGGRWPCSRLRGSGRKPCPAQRRRDRLAEMICVLKKRRLEPKRLKLFSGGGRVYLALVEAVKGGRAGLEIENEKGN